MAGGWNGENGHPVLSLVMMAQKGEKELAKDLATVLEMLQTKTRAKMLTAVNNVFNIQKASVA